RTLASLSRHVRFVPIADILNVQRNRKTASRRSVRNTICCFRHAASAAAFRFLRHPNSPKTPRPVAKSGRAAGSGVAVGLEGDATAWNEGTPNRALKSGELRLTARTSNDTPAVASSKILLSGLEITNVKKSEVLPAAGDLVWNEKPTFDALKNFIL